MLKVEQHTKLKNKTTIRLGGIAPYYCKVKSTEELLAFADFQNKTSLEFKILGGGSNLLIADESIYAELPFGVLDMDITGTENITFLDEKDLRGTVMPPLVQDYLSRNHKNFAKVNVGCGYKIPKLLTLCKKHGFTGLEGLIGIPCRVGGTVYMNAGAYKTEINDVLFNVTLYSKKMGIKTISRENIACEYRKTHLFCNKQEIHDAVILHTEFIFPIIEAKTVAYTMSQNYQTKKNTQPVQAWTAGCVFKNPYNEKGEKISAGLLLDKAGLKDIHINGMQFSKVHASFLENTGNGKTKDALELLSIAKDKILTLFNIQLEEEVKIWI